MDKEKKAEELSKEFNKKTYEDVEFKWTKRIAFGDIEAADEEHLVEKVNEQLNRTDLREEEIDTWIEVDGERIDVFIP